MCDNNRAISLMVYVGRVVLQRLSPIAIAIAIASLTVKMTAAEIKLPFESVALTVT